MKRRLLYITVLLALIACAPEPVPPPQIRLESPQPGLEVAQGERVLVESIATGEGGVTKTELWVDGRLYEVKRPEGSNGEFAAIQIWEASSLGTHTLSVKAHDRGGQTSMPASVEIQVVPLQPTPTPLPAMTPTTVVDPECELSARFVEDVTVPDDSLFNGGVNFTKVWRLRNDGECTWPPGMVWAFISGSLLGAQSPVPVELAAPDRIVDVSVDMVAPAAPGTYRSYWRLQDQNGEFFGDQAYVRIIVP